MKPTHQMFTLLPICLVFMNLVMVIDIASKNFKSGILSFYYYMTVYALINIGAVIILLVKFNYTPWYATYFLLMTISFYTFAKTNFVLFFFKGYKSIIVILIFDLFTLFFGYSLYFEKLNVFVPNINLYRIAYAYFKNQDLKGFYDNMIINIISFWVVSIILLCVPLIKMCKSKISFKQNSIFKKNALAIYDLSVLNILTNINCTFSKNSLNLIIGANGSGKSTLFKMLNGNIDNLKASGSILYDSLNIGYCSQYTLDSLFLNWTVYENLMYLALLKNNNFKNAKMSVLKNIVEFKLSNFENCKVSQLSGGEQRLVSIASAFLNDADIIILDEPFDSLDANTKFFLSNLLNYYSKTKCLIISSHEFDYLDNIDTVLHLKNGEITEFNSIRHLNQIYNLKYSTTVEFKTLPNIKWVFEFLNANYHLKLLSYSIHNDDSNILKVEFNNFETARYFYQNVSMERCVRKAVFKNTLWGLYKELNETENEIFDLKWKKHNFLKIINAEFYNQFVFLYNIKFSILMYIISVVLICLAPTIATLLFENNTTVLTLGKNTNWLHSNVDEPFDYSKYTGIIEKINGEYNISISPYYTFSHLEAMHYITNEILATKNLKIEISIKSAIPYLPTENELEAKKFIWDDCITLSVLFLSNLIFFFYFYEAEFNFDHFKNSIGINKFVKLFVNLIIYYSILTLIILICSCLLKLSLFVNLLMGTFILTLHALTWIHLIKFNNLITCIASFSCLEILFYIVNGANILIISFIGQQMPLYLIFKGFNYKNVFINFGICIGLLIIRKLCIFVFVWFKFRNSKYNKFINCVKLNLDNYNRIGVCGQNGSGKSLLFDILAGKTNSNNVLNLKNCVYIPQINTLNFMYTPFQILYTFALYYNLENPKQSVDKLVKYFELSNVQNTLLKNCNGGSLKKIHICIAFISHAPIGIFDEPFNNLDCLIKEKLETCLKFKSKYLLSCHDSEKLNNLCNYIINVEDINNFN